jgi:hypothetical protein
MKRRKHQLPCIHKFDLTIDLERLQSECDAVALSFIDVVSANPALCKNHMGLVNDVYDNFEQINLTELDGEELAYTDDIKKRIRRREETRYNKPTALYTGSYFEEIVNMFSAPAMRVRITKLAPGKVIPFHIDYDPTYATRIIVPIYTDSDVRNLFKRKDNLENHNLEAGKAFFLNTGFAHSVENNSSASRIALMFSLDGQEDLTFDGI